MVKRKIVTVPVGRTPVIRETTLGELGHFLRGKGLPRRDLVASGLPCITYGEIYTRYDNYVTELESRTTKEAANRALELQTGDIMMVASGEDAIEIGKAVAYIGDELSYAGGDIIVLRGHEQNSVFLAHLLNSEDLRRQKARLGKGHSIVHIHTPELKRLCVELPAIDHQNKVADILQTWDRAYNKLVSFREAKERRYVGLTYQLIRSASELDETAQKPLGEVARLEKGEQLNRLDIVAGEYPVWNGGITPSGFHNAWNTHGDAITISGGGASCGFVNRETRKFWRGGSCYAVYPLPDEMDSDYLFHYLKYREPHIMNLRVGSALPSIRRRDLELTHVPVPPLAQQERTAKVLNAGCRELELIQANIDALAAQKQGLMQKFFPNSKQ